MPHTNGGSPSGSDPAGSPGDTGASTAQTVGTIAAALSIISSIVSGIGGLSRREKIEKAIKRQIKEVSGREEGIREYFESLRGVLGEEFGLKERGLLERFLGESYDIRRASETSEARLGFARHGGREQRFETGLERLGEAREVEVGGLRQAFTTEQLALGRQEETELQHLRDVLYQLETQRQTADPGRFRNVFRPGKWRL